MQLRAAAEQLGRAARDSVAVASTWTTRTRAPPPGHGASRLAAPGPDLPRAVSAAHRLDTALAELLRTAKPAGSRWRMMMTRRARVPPRSTPYGNSTAARGRVGSADGAAAHPGHTDLLRSHTGTEA